MRSFELVSLVVALSGCGKVLGIDEYAVSSDCPSGAFRDTEGRCVTAKDCGPTGVQQVTGECAKAGVPEERCGDLFVADPDHPGGCREIFPSDCTVPSLVSIGNTKCELTLGCNAAPNPGNVGLVVRADAEPGGDGTIEKPLRTIQEALDKSAADPEVGITLAPGTYEGPVVIARAKVAIFGFCPPDTKLVGGDATRPVVEFVAGSDGSSINSLVIDATQASAGVRIDGASNITVGGALVIESPEGPGVTFENTSGPTSGTVQNAVIHAAVGAGIAAYGVTSLKIQDVRIIDTRPGPADGSGVGIVVEPEVSTTTERRAGTTWDESKAARSTVTVQQTRVEGASGAGIQVRGSDLTVTRSVVKRVGPDTYGRSTGIRVERRWLGALPATLTLRQSVVSEVQGSGVRLDDVDSATIEDTTIREVAAIESRSISGYDEGAPTYPGCTGNGIRTRSVFSRVPKGDAGAATVSHVTLRRSLIEDVRESGIHVEGGELEVDSSIVRNVQGCAAAFGDGIAAYDYTFAHATATVSGSRLSGVKRAGVAAFDASVSIDGSAIDSAEPLVRVAGRGEPDVRSTKSLCGTGNAWRPCEPTDRALEPALLGYPACDPAKFACVSGCWADLSSAASSNPQVLPRTVGWDPDHDAAAAYFTEGTGCYHSAGPANHDVRMLGLLDGYTPTIGSLRLPRGDILAPLGELVIATSFGFHKSLFRPDREEADGRNAVYVAFEACKPLDGPVDPIGPDVCFGRGIDGIEGELLDSSLQPIVGPEWAKPLYFGRSVGNPESGLTHTTTNAAGYFYNVPAGRYFIRLKPPPATTMSCTPYAPNTLAIGWPAKEPNTFVAIAEARFSNVVVRAFCDVR